MLVVSRVPIETTSRLRRWGWDDFVRKVVGEKRFSKVEFWQTPLWFHVEICLKQIVYQKFVRIYIYIYKILIYLCNILKFKHCFFFQKQKRYCKVCEIKLNQICLYILLSPKSVRVNNSTQISLRNHHPEVVSWCSMSFNLQRLYRD